MLAGPVQVAYAVADVDAAAQHWAAQGIGPFFVIDHIQVHNVRVRGQSSTFDHSSAYAQWGSVMVELICQHDAGADPVVATTGVHHMAHFVNSFTAASAELTHRDIPEVLYAETAAGMSFAFHDARPMFGHFIEIYERTDRLARFYNMVGDASINWNGADPIRRM